MILFDQDEWGTMPSVAADELEAQMMREWAAKMARVTRAEQELPEQLTLEV